MEKAVVQFRKGDVVRCIQEDMWLAKKGIEYTIRATDVSSLGEQFIKFKEIDWWHEACNFVLAKEENEI